MKLQLGTSALISLILSSSLSASPEVTTPEMQKIRREIEPHLTTKRPYPFPDHHAAAPPNCRLLHINHLARHGSRHLVTKRIFHEKIVDVLQQLQLITADSTGKLIMTTNPAITEQGQILVRRMLEIISTYMTNPELIGNLTPQGRDELKSLGSTLFISTGMRQADIRQQIAARKIKAESTYKTRTQDSRQAFLAGLSDALDMNSLNHHVDLVTPQQGDIDQKLRFYDHCSAYFDKQAGARAEGNRKIQAELGKNDIQEALYRLGSNFVTGLTSNEYKELFMVMYELCQLDSNTGYQLGICSLLVSQDDKNSCLQAANQVHRIRQYHIRGPAKKFEDINRVMAIKLLTDWLNATEAGISKPDSYFVNLRFAHDSTLLRFEQILDLVTPENSTDENGNITWDLGWLSPMSANLVWQTFACESETTPGTPVYRVRMLLNEVTTPFPAAGCDTDNGLCDWEKVNHYYRLRTQNLSFKGHCEDLVFGYESDL